MADELDWRAIREAEEREADRLLAQQVALMREAIRARVLEAWAAHAAAGRRAWKAHVRDLIGGRTRWLLCFERTEARMRRNLAQQAYEVLDLEPWTGPMPDPLTGRVEA